jgi:hypothetical protein
MKTFQEMLGPDCGRDIDRQIRAIVGEFHRNVENLCKEEFDYFALANGYVKAADYEALKAKVAELTDRLEDATDTLDLIESEADLFDATAIASGYVKLEPGQVVVDGEKLLYVLHNSKYPVLDDGTCTIDAAEELLRAIKEARDARV